MKKTEPKSQDSRSRRVLEQASLLEQALARPGVREVMQVYGGWKEKDQALDVYRSATKIPVRTVTTNTTNAL